MTALTDPLAEGAVQAVLEAGRLLADPAAVRSIRAKSETDYVTNVDLAVQEFLRERLAALAPDVQFMGEEQDNAALDWSRPCWILDPVDGTTNLIHNSGTARFPWPWRRVDKSSLVWYTILIRRSASPPAGAAEHSEMGFPSRSAPSLGWRTASCPRAPFPAGGSWRTRRFGRCGRCMTGARTSGGRAVPAWNCAMWPADGWRAMWSCLSSRGTTPLECSSWRRPGDRLPLLAAPPLSGGGWASAGLQWAAPQRTANNFEGMRVSSWTCAFPPPLGS